MRSTKAAITQGQDRHRTLKGFTTPSYRTPMTARRQNNEHAIKKTVFVTTQTHKCSVTNLASSLDPSQGGHYVQHRLVPSEDWFLLSAPLARSLCHSQASRGALRPRLALTRRKSPDKARALVCRSPFDTPCCCSAEGRRRSSRRRVHRAHSQS